MGRPVIRAHSARLFFKQIESKVYLLVGILEADFHVLRQFVFPSNVQRSDIFDVAQRQRLQMKLNISVRRMNENGKSSASHY